MRKLLRDWQVGDGREEACARYDPAHSQKATRRNWGVGPAWIQGGTSYATRPKAPRWTG